MANDDRPPSDGAEPGSDGRTVSKATAGPTADPDPAQLWVRLQTQLAQLRAQVQRLNRALTAVEEVRSAAPPDPPDAPAQAPTVAPAAAPPPTPLPPASINGGGAAGDRLAERVAGRVSERADGRPSEWVFGERRKGERRQVDRGCDRRGRKTEAAGQPSTSTRIDVGGADLTALIRAGFLLRHHGRSPHHVAKAIQQLLLHWRYATFGPDEPEHVRTGGAGGDTGERRSGRERRREAPRSNCLLSYVKNSKFDRRRGERRRPAGTDGGGAAAAGFGKRNRNRDRAPASGTLVRLADVRAARLGSRRRAPGTDRGAQGIEGVKGEPRPGQGEGEAVRGRHRFLEDEQSEEKVAGRRDVLEEADGHQPDPPGAGDEEDER